MHLVNQVHLVDLGALLALGVDSAEALEAAATSGHLLHADDAGAFLGALKRRHEPGDAGTNHHKIAILGGGQLVGGNLAILKAHRPARTGAGRLPYGHPGGVARKAVGVLAGFGSLFGGNGHTSAAEGGHGARSRAGNRAELRFFPSWFLLLSLNPLFGPIKFPARSTWDVARALHCKVTVREES